MDLILWRHCDAEPGEPDLERRLTAKGIQQAERVARWLEERLPERCRIIASPAERTQQTALALGRKFKTHPDLAPGAGVAAVLAAARWPDARDPVLVVGHQPTLGAVAAHLLAGSDLDWTIRKGAVWWLANRRHERDAPVILRAAIAPDLV
jgi:phosphohistidine phosphatase